VGATSTAQPGDRRPAPPPLDLVQAFVNSWDREGGHDEFASPDTLAAWLRRYGLVGGGEPVSARALRETIELREAIRELLLEHNGQRADATARATFGRFAGRVELSARLERDGAVVVTAEGGGIKAAWAHILAAIVQASAEGTWPRLKACRSDLCRWAFYDHSKNRSSHWCTEKMCGSRDRMRRYRRRARAAATQ
jgi:predicted RNA-binding Zn ribbon-like protein